MSDLSILFSSSRIPFRNGKGSARTHLSRRLENVGDEGDDEEADEEDDEG